jgi:uncharacterized protein involved in type VI secretion and phage assembly
MSDQSGGGPARMYGLHPAIVTDIVDPERLGRIQVRFPWLGMDGDRDVRAWATLLSPYAEDGQGLQMLPSVGTQVVVAFEAGDPRRPYIVGTAWNGRESMPERPTETNDKRLIRSRADSLLEFDDGAGGPKVTISLQAGHRVVLDAGAQQVTIEHANGCSMVMNAAGQVEIQGNLSVDITAPVLNVRAPVANFDGIINCTTVIASAGVVSPSYTPGAGNVW